MLIVTINSNEEVKYINIVTFTLPLDYILYKFIYTDVSNFISSYQHGFTLKGSTVINLSVFTKQQRSS